MEKLLEKLSSYNILNNILPGVIMTYIFEALYQVEISEKNLVENMFVYYFIGLIVNRIGSLVIEPIAKQINLVKYAPYNDYISATVKDKSIEILLETNNVYRTFLAVAFISVLMMIHSCFLIDNIKLSNKVSIAICIIGLVILFAFSYHKQTKYIVNRINKVNEKEVQNEHN